MHDLKTILEGWRDVKGASQPAVMATVVHVTGSAYRRPGARMLILPDGRRVGSASGGCLEGDVCRKAWWLTTDGQPALRVYDTMSEDDAVWEFGLGCNGVVHVLLERVDSGAAHGCLEFLEQCLASRCQAVVATVIRATAEGRARVADRLLVAGELREGALAGGPVEEDLLPQVRTCLRERKGRLVRLEDCEVFLEWVGPPAPLVVFGAGHDAIPLVAFAKQLGWHVTVADVRPAYARPDRFAGVDRVVLMTHNYPLDLKLLPPILEAAPRYIGLLGPNKRTDRLFAELG
jgi:xanthine/CO dehydrogenase XdhC/CoxF family maturation factor